MKFFDRNDPEEGVVVASTVISCQEVGDGAESVSETRRFGGFEAHPARPGSMGAAELDEPHRFGSWEHQAGGSQ